MFFFPVLSAKTYILLSDTVILLGTQDVAKQILVIFKSLKLYFFSRIEVHKGCSFKKRWNLMY